MTIEVSNLTIPVMMRLKMAVNESFCSAQDKSLKLHLKTSKKVNSFCFSERILAGEKMTAIQYLI